LVVEDIEQWAYTLERAARRAGASEVVVCANLQQVKDELRRARFDVAILDVGLDPDDDLNKDGVKVLEAIREIDQLGTRCILVTGWQGDRLDLQSEAQQRFGIDWAYMKERYEAHAVIAKLAELLNDAAARRLAPAMPGKTTPMGNLSANGDDAFFFEGRVVDTLSPTGGMPTLYSLVSRLLSSAIPMLAMRPGKPMEFGPSGVIVGVYWSRSLATAVAVGLATADAWQREKGAIPAGLTRLLPVGTMPDLIEEVQERNIAGRLWELPGLDRDDFPG
jgi:CheY-like chemotaxis protein